jgi:hypothetical protein
MMFADDTTLVAKSRKALQAMLCDIERTLRQVGMRLNTDKCNIQRSMGGRRDSRRFSVAGKLIQLVPNTEGFKVLGTICTLNGKTDVEFASRLQVGWNKFFALRPLLTKRDSSIVKRMQLFNSTVSKTVLWCSESWKLTVKQKRHLQATQRSMLRRIVCIKRHPDEDYVDWIRRATRRAEGLARAAGVPCWVEEHLNCKWRWGRNIANMQENMWAQKTTFWRDAAWSAEQPRGSSRTAIRSRRGHFTRWEGDFVKYAGMHGWDSWQSIAADEQTWKSHEADFIKTFRC